MHASLGRGLETTHNQLYKYKYKRACAYSVFLRSLSSVVVVELALPCVRVDM